MKNKHGASDSRKTSTPPTSVAPRPLSNASFESYDDIEEKQQVV
jgi:hypothetical protein